jgi:chromate transporter
MIATLVKLAALFLMLSLLAVGSGNTVIPDMQRAAVQVNGWMTDREFLNLFAVSRLAPGPGSLLVTLIGERAAGPLGALVATAAMFGPSCFLVYLVSGIWHRYRNASWRGRVERGLAPISIGLIFASAIALLRGTQHDVATVVLSALATAVLTFTELHPLWVVAACAVAGFALNL